MDRYSQGKQFALVPQRGGRDEPDDFRTLDICE